MTARPRLLVLVGPTGTGKSALALELATRLGGEIVSCDAFQVYRGLEIGTAKPTVDERRRVVHHAIDCADPRHGFSMVEWERIASSAIAQIAARGAVPLVVGGTGLYARALLRGFIPTPKRDLALRERLQRVAARRGAAFLHRCLVRRDAASASRLHPGDTQRIIRALELARGGSNWSERLARAGNWATGEERYPTLKIGLDRDRLRLNSILDARVDRFFERGLVAEIEALLAAGVPPEANALRAIGYREVVQALLAGTNPGETRDQVRRRTRAYSKRQRTWFRRERDLEWLDSDRSVVELAEQVVARW